MNTTGPVMTVTDELLAELDGLAAGATEGPWKYETDEDSCYGAVFVKPDTEHYSPPICRIDHDVTAEFVAATDPTTIMALTAELRRLRAENAELAKDAGRYRLFAETVSAECQGHEMTRQQGALFGCMNGVETATIEELDAMFDTAMAAK